MNDLSLIINKYIKEGYLISFKKFKHSNLSEFFSVSITKENRTMQFPCQYEDLKDFDIERYIKLFDESSEGGSCK